MADFWKRIAVLALAAAAGCSDTFPPAVGPLDRFYFPVGLAVRRLPDGRSALLVVSSNFDLRYDYDVGGAVVAVDPDDSGDARPVAEGGQADPTLDVLGGVNIGSFGGEVAYLAGTEPTEYPEGVCPTLAADPLVAAGGAKVVVASRGTQEVYAVDMDAGGSLTCDGCARKTDLVALDPFGVTVACASQGGLQSAKAYVTHLRAPQNLGHLSELDLVTGRLDPGRAFPFSTYASTYDPVHGRLFVSTRLGSFDVNPLSWLYVLLPEMALSFWNVSGDVKGSLTRNMVVSEDGLTGYLVMELFDYNLAAQTGTVVGTGGALGIYDLSETALGEPVMKLQRLVPVCLGSGQIRRIGRPPKRDLLAITCDFENTLLLYDDEVGAVAARIALGQDGRPLLGRQPFGLAVESRQAGRCRSGTGACVRLYVGSFDRSWVSLLELDPNNPTSVSRVKRIGRERD